MNSRVLDYDFRIYKQIVLSFIMHSVVLIYLYIYFRFYHILYKVVICFRLIVKSLSLFCLLHMSRDARKPVFGVSDQVRHKPVYAVSENG